MLETRQELRYRQRMKASLPQNYGPNYVQDVIVTQSSLYEWKYCTYSLLNHFHLLKLNYRRRKVSYCVFIEN